MSKTYMDSPFGKAVHPHLNKPDTKFNADGLYKVGLALGGAEAEAFKAKIDAASQAAFDDYFANGAGKMATPGERKKFSVYYPYKVDEDDDGNPTGYIEFEFKQNAKIKLRDGTTKAVEIGIYDAKGKPMRKIVGNGSELRVNYSMRAIAVAGTKQVGVRLDFGRVQVKKLETFGGGGFGAVDGYEDDGAVQEQHPDNSPADTGAADY